MPFLKDHWEFWKQFRQRFETTGAVAPSSHFLAAALTSQLRRRAEGPVRVLEIGPGTGAVTNQIVRLLRPEDRFDLVELNETFVQLLQDRFQQHPDYQRVAEQSRIHKCPIQEFQSDAGYDYIISGLPLNNFPPDLVRSIYESCLQLLNPGGSLSYFEYMYVRPARRLVSGRDEKQRLAALDATMNEYLSAHRFDRDWVFVNLPPAWVQHLRRPAAETADNQADCESSATRS